MQPAPPPPPPAVPYARSRFGLLLALGALVLVAAAGVGGYLVGASSVGHATLRVQVSNHTNANLSAQITVNGVLAGSLTVPSDQTASLDVPVSYATANGAMFELEASTAAGPRDGNSVFVNTPGIFVVALQLG